MSVIDTYHIEMLSQDKLDKYLFKQFLESFIAFLESSPEKSERVNTFLNNIKEIIQDIDQP